MARTACLVCLISTVNGTAHIRHQCRKTASCLKPPQISNQLWCLKNEQYLNMDKNFDHQMSLSKSKCLYSYSCLHQKSKKSLGRCGASSGHITKLEQSIFLDIYGLYSKIFMIVIYDRNDSALCYKTTIPTYLALARSMNYDSKVRCKLWPEL